MLPRLVAVVMSLVAATYLATAVAAGIPVFDHVIVVVMENHGYAQIVGSADAPYINSLAASGANFTNYHAITHPSQPNYIALFSGDTHGVTDDSCPKNFTGVANLGSQLIGAGLSFTGYSEGLPQAGYTGCSSGLYARKHNPWVDFDTVPATDNQPFTMFPSDYSTLPTLAFVIPNLCNDMHNCSVATGDTWLQTKMDGYAQWARTHNSLLILTWDEDEGSQINLIATLFVGAHITPGIYAENGDHYRTLATLEAMYGLPAIGHAVGVAPITDIWSDVIFANGFESGTSL
ncbi:MAG: alkaline phosphatase family protein [Dokdonella sp.]